MPWLAVSGQHCKFVLLGIWLEAAWLELDRPLFVLAALGAIWLELEMQARMLEISTSDRQEKKCRTAASLGSTSVAGTAAGAADSCGAPPALMSLVARMGSKAVTTPISSSTRRAFISSLACYS